MGEAITTPIPRLCSPGGHPGAGGRLAPARASSGAPGVTEYPLGKPGVPPHRREERGSGEGDPLRTHFTATPLERLKAAGPQAWRLRRERPGQAGPPVPPPSCWAAPAPAPGLGLGAATAGPAVWDAAMKNKALGALCNLGSVLKRSCL